MPGPTELPGPVLARLARFGRVHLLDTVTSTNDYALSLAGRHEPAVVIARRQTRGRGRLRRPWYSDDDSLTFSLLIFPTETAQIEAVTSIIGLALARALSATTGIEARIRWPNDITVKDRKLCGVLCERRRDAIAVGVGLNVNQTEFPPELPEAVSLRQLTGRTYNPFELLEPVVDGFFALLSTVTTNGTDELVKELKERSAVLHRRVEVTTMLRRHVGTVVDLDREGRIVLRTDSGRIVVLAAGQVRRLSQ